MTSPVSSGFPDFGRFVSEAQVLEINDINVTIAHGFGYPPKYVGNAKSLQLWANAPSHGMRIQCVFSGDEAGTQLMDSYVVNLATSDVAKQPIPILGPWLEVVIQHSDGAPNSVTVQLWRTPAMARFAGLEGDVAIVSKDAAGIGAGVSVASDGSQYVMEGPAVWAAGVTGGSWDASLNAVDYLGVATQLDHASNLTGFLVPRPVYLPPWHIRIDVVNRAAGAQFYSAFCTRRHNE